MNKILFIIVSLIFSFSLMARDVAIVSGLAGNAFMIKNGSTKALSLGDTVEDFAEIYTEEGSQLTLSDHYDHIYYLSGSGHIKFLNKIIELKSGYLRVQSYQQRVPFFVQTSNAQLRYIYGDGIISFDQVSGKTQLLAVKGTFQFSNIREGELYVDVPYGTFSFVNDSFNQGLPRNPTPIGFDSFKKITSLFARVDQYNIEEYKKKKESGRAVRKIASVPEQDLKGDWVPVGESSNDGPAKELKQREAAKPVRLPSSTERVYEEDGVIIIKKAPAVSRKPSSFDKDQFYKKELKKIKRTKKRNWRPSYNKKSNVKVKIFGVKSTAPAASSAPKVKKVPATSKRIPASVGASSAKKSIVDKVQHQPADDFQKSMSEQYKSQMRHSNEVNSLIDELKSFKSDYQKEY